MVKRIAKILAVLAFCSLVVTFREVIVSAGSIASSADPAFLGLSIVGLFIYRVFNATGWGKVANALGGQVGLVDGASVWLKTESFRWLPGSVWGYCSRALLGQQLGLNRQQASLSLTLELSLTLGAWIGTALIFSLISSVSIFPSGLVNLIATLGITGIFGLSLMPVLYKTSAKVRRHVKELITLKDFEIKPLVLLEVLIFYSVLCCFNGFCFFLICSSLGITSLSIGQALAANSQAFLIGLFALIAPGGIGVREGSLAAILSSYTSVETALAAALLWRGTQLLVELICLLVVFAEIALKSRFQEKEGYLRC